MIGGQLNWMILEVFSNLGDSIILQERRGQTLQQGLWQQDKGDGFKLKEGRFRLDIKEKVSTVTVVRHWN